jgi:hypothetical protein
MRCLYFHISHKLFCIFSLLIFYNFCFAQIFTKSSTPWPEFPGPPKAKVEWVSSDMRVNGLPMKVLHFNSEVSKAEIVAYYQAHWDKVDPSLGIPASEKVKGAVVSQMGKDTIIGKVHGPYYMSVKVKDKGFGGATGTMTTSLILGITPEINIKGVPAPSNVKAISVVESADFGKQSKQVLFISDGSITSIKNYYENSLPAAGWRALDSHGDGQNINGMRGFIQSYVRKKQQLDIIIANDVAKNATVINANLISF